MQVTSVPDSDSRIRGLLDERSDRNVSDQLRSEALVASKSQYGSGDVRPRSPPMSWMTAITTSVNSLWRTLYGGQSIPTTAMTVEAGDVIVRQPQSLGGLPQFSDNRLPSSIQEALVDNAQTEYPVHGNTQSSDRRIWRLNSETAIALDEPQVKRREPGLDLRIPPRSGRSMRAPGDLCTRDRTHKRELTEADGRQRRLVPDQRRDTRRSRSAGEEVRKFRQTDGRHVDRKGQSPRRSKERPGSENKYDGRTDDRRSRRRESSRSNHRADRRRNDSCRARDGGSSPSSSDDDGDSSDRDRRRRPNRRPSRLKRRDDLSPDGGDGSDDDGSSENDDRVEAHATSKRLHIKLQKFDGTGSWESWWAHFQNCASYNNWTRRDKLAFLKGALTGNAAQVL